MRAFSLQSSLAKLFKSRQKEQDDEDNDFAIFDGLRVISLSAIILGNTYFMILKGPIQNMEVI
jgi:hypothetical protein